MSDDSRQDFRGRRWFAATYDFRSGSAERRVISKHRPLVVGEAQGRVLEIGIGTGASLSYYDWSKVEALVGTDPDPHMLKRARKRVADLELKGVELKLASAEELPFEDHDFDHVVSTIVLCTVRDVPRSLAEVKRVLKPGGTFRFIEHVRFDSGLRGRLQDIITPVWRWLGGGCHPNRRIADSLTEAGFEVQNLQRDTLMGIEPLIAGVARRP